MNPAQVEPAGGHRAPQCDSRGRRPESPARVVAFPVSLGDAVRRRQEDGRPDLRASARLRGLVQVTPPGSLRLGSDPDPAPTSPLDAARGSRRGEWHESSASPPRSIAPVRAERRRTVRWLSTTFPWCGSCERDRAVGTTGGRSLATLFLPIVADCPSASAGRPYRRGLAQSGGRQSSATATDLCTVARSLRRT